MTDRATLQAHIDELAAERDIVVVQQYNMPGMMYVEESPPRIEIPSLAPSPIIPSVTVAYYVALHEIGHVEHGHTQGRPPHNDLTFYFDNGVLRSEAQAWEFALDVAIVKPKRREATFMAERYIGSYISGARQQRGRPYRLQNGNRHWVEFVFDDPNDPYVQGVVSRLANAHKETDVLT